jgi:DNA polymerase
MGASDMGLSDDEIEDIVVKWRKASPNIVNLWRGVNTAARHAIETGRDHYPKMPANDYYLDLKFGYDGSSLIIRLPSGRSLFYQNAHVGLNRFGSESIIYDGITANKTWGQLETYGGKLVENIVQATARDLLCNAMRKLTGLRICMHIHDEVVIEADESVQLSDVCRKMAEVPDWATGLILNADGYETPFYKKD